MCVYLAFVHKLHKGGVCLGFVVPIDSQVSTPNNVGMPASSPMRAESPDVTLSKPQQGPNTPMTPDVRLWHRAVVVHQVWGWSGQGARGHARH